MTFLKCYCRKIKVVNVDGTYLNHLRCSDDIVLISSDIQELKNMLEQLNKAANYQNKKNEQDRAKHKNKLRILLIERKPNSGDKTKNQTDMNSIWKTGSYSYPYKP